MNKEYRNYLNSKEWAEIRIDLFNQRGFKCENCNKKFKSQKGLEIHHLNYKNIFKEEPKDLLILCSSCHRLEHKQTKSDKPIFKNAKEKKAYKKRQKILKQMKHSKNWQSKMSKYN